MDRSQLPPTAFIDPSGENRDAITALFQKVLTQLLDHLSSASEQSPLPPTIGVEALATIPNSPIDEKQLLDRLDRIVSASMNAANPGYIGHMDTMPTVISVLGDLVASAINNNMLSVEMSPIFSRLEPLLLKQFSDLFGLGQTAGGVLLSGGTLANLQALAVARNIKFQALQNGIVGLKQQPIVFASEAAHTSVKKAAMILGMGISAVVSIPTNQDSQMSIPALEAHIEKAKAANQSPFCIIATAGTTTTGNIDSLEEIHQIAQAHQLWLHVDASYGGALIFSPEYRHLIAGIEHADSITFNPQKWLYVAKTCVMVLFKRFTDLNVAFRVQAPYMKAQDSLTNIGEVSIQGTRHVDILKLWLSVQYMGKQSYAHLINESYRLTKHFMSEIRKRPFLTLASTPEMNIICFRGVPSNLSPDHWDKWNTELQAHLLKFEGIFCSLPLYQEHRWLRVVLLNPYTGEDRITQMFETIDSFMNCNL